jgi:hypothetical protein
MRRRAPRRCLPLGLESFSLAGYLAPSVSHLARGLPFLGYQA